MERSISLQSHGFGACSEGRFLFLCADCEHVFLKLYFTACLQHCLSCACCTGPGTRVCIHQNYFYIHLPTWNFIVTWYNLGQTVAKAERECSDVFAKDLKSQLLYFSFEQTALVEITMAEMWSSFLHLKAKQLGVQWMETEPWVSPTQLKRKTTQEDFLLM